MSWDVIQQIIRIALYTGGSYLFGEGVADGAEYQAFIGGAITVIAFIWWAIRQAVEKRRGY